MGGKQNSLVKSFGKKKNVVECSRSMTCSRYLGREKVFLDFSYFYMRFIFLGL